MAWPGPVVPNVARMWDYYLGGTENTEADRDAARIVLGAAPDVPLAALENREFLRHAVRFLAEGARIAQFIDGCELAEPGVACLSQWRPATSYYAGGGTRWAYAGVGRIAGRRDGAGAAS